MTTDKARELLERVVGRIDVTESESRQLSREIRAYLAEPEQDEEPIGYVYSEYGNPRKNVALSNDSIQNGTPVYVHPSQRPDFVRLSEEDIIDITSGTVMPTAMGIAYKDAIRFARAIEDALEEKNK